MCRAAMLFVLTIAVSTGYIGSPLVTAWWIKEAIKSGDADYLEHRISWTPVKVSLKESLADMAVGPSLASTTGGGRPSLWQRTKAGYGRYMVHNLVDRYATPSGLPTLFSYGRRMRRNVMGQPDPDEGLALPGRIASAWARVTRAEFVSLTRFAMEMRDKYDANRLYQGVLVFEGLGWKLVDLRVIAREVTKL